MIRNHRQNMALLETNIDPIQIAHWISSPYWGGSKLVSRILENANSRLIVGDCNIVNGVLMYLDVLEICFVNDC